MAEPNAQVLTPTPTDDGKTRRYADFTTLGEALDYAAEGQRGLNFHDPRGNLARPYPYTELRKDALDAALSRFRSPDLDDAIAVA